MPKTTGPLTRAAPLRASTWNPDNWTVQAVLSTGAPVARADSRGAYVEVLDLNQPWPSSIPLLDSHSRGSVDDRLGEVIDIKTVGAEVVGTVKLSRHNERAKRVAAELTDGATYAVSIGYSVLKWAETKPAGKRTLTAATFQLLEASLTTVPADHGAGLRSTESLTTPAITTNEPAVPTRAQLSAEVRSIATTTGLDAAWTATQLDAEIIDLNAVRAAALDALSARSATTGTVRASVGNDNNDPIAIRTAMADALAHRIAPGVVKVEGRASEYAGYRVLDMVGELATARGDRVNLRDQGALLERAVGAHSTSDFPLLLAEATNKALMANYTAAAPTYRKWAAKRPFADFRDHSFLRIGDFPEFKDIAESGEVKFGTISENREKIRAKELGTGIAVGRQLLINDDLSALSDFSGMISIRAASDENKRAYAVLTANAALSDGVALFHATHGNKAGSGTAIDAANVGAAVAGMRKQKSLDGLLLNLAPAYLVCGPDREMAARQLLASINATKSSEVNPWAGLAELVIDANIVGNQWYLFASPAMAPTIVFGYVNGAEGPIVRTERDFDTQAIKVAASLDFAVGAIDFRGAYSNSGA